MGMIYETPKSEVYAKVDDNYIIAIDGGYTVSNVDTTDSAWVKIDEGTGDRYNLCQNNYLSPLWADDAPAYYLDGDTVRETTAAEREAWVAAHTPTTEESTEDIVLEMLADHEERICLMELGVE